MVKRSSQEYLLEPDLLTEAKENWDNFQVHFLQLVAMQRLLLGFEEERCLEHGLVGYFEMQYIAKICAS